jgi:acyl carrier protein
MNEAANRLESLVLTVHRRNGGDLRRLDFGSRLLAPELRLDSLDLAEVVVAIEREFGVAPFEAPQAPRTWRDVLELVAPRDDGGKHRPG